MDIRLQTPDQAAPRLDMPLGGTSKPKPPRDIDIDFSATPAKQLKTAPKRPILSANPMATQHTTSPPPSRDIMQSFSDFANPTKRRPEPTEGFASEFGDDDDGEERPPNDQDEDYEEEEEEEEEEDDVAGDYMRGADEPLSADPLRPTEGFKSLDEERADILCKLNRLKRQGMAGVRSFGIGSDIREMRAELERVRTEIDLDASIRWQRKMLMACVSTMEFANRRWNPFDLQLNGWSENVMESITDYDRVFERLFFKYRSKVSMPPEAELLLAVGTSAFMFHLTSTMFKKESQNPAFMEQMAQAMARAQANAQANAQAPPQQTQADQSPPAAPADGQRREIRGPGALDFSAFLGGAMPPAPMPPPPVSSRTLYQEQQQQQQAQDIQKKKRKAPSVSSEEDEDDQSDFGRISDVVSEDLASIPDDLSSVEDEGLKTLTIETKTPRGRGSRGGASAKQQKKVVLI